MHPNQWLVIYQRQNASTGQELTSNVALTVATLEAQGFIIIDIVDGG